MILAPAVEIAAALYEKAGLVLARDLETYLRDPFGYVVKTPELLLLGRPVLLAAPLQWVRETGKADAWYIRLLVGRGRLAAAIREMPYYLPWCCWHRNFRAGPTGRLHVMPSSKLIARGGALCGR